jgi:sugar/nucleoside kinase (ribokinase family)
MHRHFRLIPDFNLWAENFDFIQVNRNELFTLSSKTNEEEIALEVLSYGTKYLILTLEDKGAKIFFMEDDKLKFIYEPAIKVEVRNKVGCGDVFGASFFYSYISQREKNIEIALKTANIAAGCSASYEKISEFKNMKRDVSLRIY